MVKYCTHCGAQNEDQASFCTTCGQKLVEQVSQATYPPSSPATAPPQPGATVLRFGLVHGDHKFVMGSVEFQDESGKTAYNATRESALHENYTLFQEGTKLLYMKHKTHFNASSYELQDAAGAPMGEIRCQFSHWQGQLPSISYSNQKDAPLATVVWERRTFDFAIVDPASSQVFAQASAELPGGVKGDLKALIRMQHRVSIAQGTSLPLAVVLAICVAVAYLPPD